MAKENEKLYNLMIQKSKCSFLLALELFNKPTIELNVEGFCIFICNAWELLLKAYLISKNQNFYYTTNENKNRSYTLSKLIKIVMTNDKDPIRINLEIVKGIRNKATHLIIPEYAKDMHPFFLACVKNYVFKLKKLVNEEINLNIDFLSLIIPNKYTEYSILEKYGTLIESDYVNTNNYLEKTFIENDNDQNLAIRYTLFVSKLSSSDEKKSLISNYNDAHKVKIITKKETQDASKTHPYRRKEILENVQFEMTKLNVKFTPYTSAKNETFTSDTFQKYSQITKIKDDSKYSYKHIFSENESRYTYSPLLIGKIIEDIKKDPYMFLNFVKTKKED